MLIKSLQDLKEFEDSCITGILDSSCGMDFCKNVGGRCYYMSVVALFYNIQSKIIYKDGFETVLHFVNKLMKQCFVRDERIRMCYNLSTEIQETYRTYMQLYYMTPDIFNFEAEHIKESGSSFKLLLSFLLQSTHSIYPRIPEIDDNENFHSEIMDYYYKTLFNRNFVKLLRENKPDIIYLKNILDDKDSYFNIFRIKIIKDYHTVMKCTDDTNDIFNFTSSIFAIVDFYDFLAQNYNHKKLLGGNFGIVENEKISGGHLLSYHICKDDGNYFKIILCDPNSRDTCQIIFDKTAKKIINLYNKKGVYPWTKVYFYEISFLLINTDYKPK